MRYILILPFVFLSTVGFAQEKPSSVVISTAKELISKSALIHPVNDIFIQYGPGVYQQIDDPYYQYSQDRGTWVLEIFSKRTRWYRDRKWQAWRLPEGDWWICGKLRVTKAPNSGLVAGWVDELSFDNGVSPREVDIRITRP